MEIMLAGSGAREAAIAERLTWEGHTLHIAAEFRNPSLVQAAKKSGGQFFEVRSVSSANCVAEAAVASQADLLWVNNDDALAAGVVDEVVARAPGMAIASPDKASARIEWDKFYAREIVDEIDRAEGTRYNPEYFLADTPEGVMEAVDYFERAGVPAVIKPRGLTGGKLVKVMGPHLKTYRDAVRYGLQIVQDQRYGKGVSIEEKVEGHEFTLQFLTDGTVAIPPPGTYDYPFREDDDRGPGCGGMGSFAMPAGELLPFLTEEAYRDAIDLTEKVLEQLRERGHAFKGVLYPSFFQTANGLKITEFNARAGDPEIINIMELLGDRTSLADALMRIAHQELSPKDVCFTRGLASAALYLVSPEYAYPGKEPTMYDFLLRSKELALRGCRAYFAAAKQTGKNRYRTVGTSRTVALAAVAPTPWEARAKIHQAIEAGVEGPLQYRRDVGAEEYIKNLAN